MNYYLSAAGAVSLIIALIHFFQAVPPSLHQCETRPVFRPWVGKPTTIAGI